MSNLVPERFRDALERVHDKLGSFLGALSPRRTGDSSPEAIGEDSAMPAFLQAGGPLIDMRETADELVVRAELPGMKRSDVSVEVVGRRLTIRGEKKVQQERKGEGGYRYSECRFGSFARSVTLPYPVEAEKIGADLKDGVLTVRLRKPEQERSRPFRITVS